MDFLEWHLFVTPAKQNTEERTINRKLNGLRGKGLTIKKTEDFDASRHLYQDTHTELIHRKSYILW